MSELLKPSSSLKGVLFDFPLTEQGSPFGGDVKSYKELFEATFGSFTIKPCENSIKPRAGRELEFEAIK